MLSEYLVNPSIIRRQRAVPYFGSPPSANVISETTARENFQRNQFLGVQEVSVTEVLAELLVIQPSTLFVADEKTYKFQTSIRPSMNIRLSTFLQLRHYPKQASLTSFYVNCSGKDQGIENRFKVEFSRRSVGSIPTGCLFLYFFYQISCLLGIPAYDYAVKCVNSCLFLFW